MFLIEGLLASAVRVWASFCLDDKPADARWPSPAEKQALSAAAAQEDRAKSAHGPYALGTVLANPRVLHFVATCFLIQMSVYGVIFCLPTQVGALLGKKVGLVTAVPWLCALAAAFALPHLADQEGNRVTCVTPAAVRTAIFDQMTQQHIDFMLSKIPLGRFGAIEEVASLVCWLASEECSFSTGAVFDVSGARDILSAGTEPHNVQRGTSP